MRISRIGSLFAANVDAIAARPRPEPPPSQPTAPIAPTEAVVVSPNFNRTPANSSESPEVRAERVKQLKDQVRKGSYSVDSKKLAEAVIRDLG